MTTPYTIPEIDIVIDSYLSRLYYAERLSAASREIEEILPEHLTNDDVNRIAQKWSTSWRSEGLMDDHDFLTLQNDLLAAYDTIDSSAQR